MKLSRFAEKFARLVSEAGFSSHDHPKKMLGFLCFLYAAPNNIAEILLRNPLVSLAVICANTCPATDKLINQSIVRGVARYLL